MVLRDFVDESAVGSGVVVDDVDGFNLEEVDDCPSDSQSTGNDDDGDGGAVVKQTVAGCIGWRCTQDCVDLH